MTDRVNGLIVVLEKDMREDDVQEIIDAIKLLKGVAKVKPQVASPMDLIAIERAKHELRMQILHLIV